MTSNSSSEESDIQYNLYFLDCQSESINRMMNNPLVFDHLYRAATTPILRFQRSYQRAEADRVTDIDELSSIITFTSSIPRIIPIEIVAHEIEEVIIPMEDPIPIETKTHIPPAPPLPPSFDVAIRSQIQSIKTTARSPDQETFWAVVEKQNIADYFDQPTNSIKLTTPVKATEPKRKTILDDRKAYNLGM